MKQVRQFVVDGQTVDVPHDEIEEFMETAGEHNTTPDEVHSFRVTDSQGRSQDVEVPEREKEEFESQAGEHGATFEPMRTLALDDGTKKTMPVREISRYLRLRGTKGITPDGAGESGQGSVAWAGTKGAIGGFFEGAWAGANAASNKIVKAIPEIGIDVESAGGNLLRFAGKGLKELGAEWLGGVVESAGEGIVGSAAGAKAWLDEMLPSDAKDWLGYEDWSTKLVDWTNNAAAMAVKFAPGMAQMGAKAFMETIFSSDGANAFARAYDGVIERGGDEFEAAALGSEAFLLNYLGGKALMNAGKYAEGLHGPVQRFLASGAASSGTMAAQNAGNKAIENLAEGKPVLEGVGKAAGEGFLEGWAFHAYNAIPGLVTGVAESRAAKRRQDEWARGEILKMVETDEGSAKLAVWLDGEALDAAIAARKAAKGITPDGAGESGRGITPDGAGESGREATPRTPGEGGTTVELAREAGLPETMTPAEVNKVLDAVANQRQALAERVRIGMDDVQAAALCETVQSMTGGSADKADTTMDPAAHELFERTWLKALGKVTDARELDDPELREKIVSKAAKEAQAEIDAERRAELAEQSRIRGASVAEQVAELQNRGISTFEDAEAAGLVKKDERGRWSGGARQAVNISVNGTEALKTAVKEGKISGDLAEEMITQSHCELGWMPKEARDAIIDKVLEAAEGLRRTEPSNQDGVLRRTEPANQDGRQPPEPLPKEEATGEVARRMMEIIGRCDRSELADVDALVRKVADEVAEGITPDGAGESGRGITPDGAGESGREATPRTPGEGGATGEGTPQTAYEGAVQAERMKGTELKGIDGGLMGCERFPEVTVEISQDGIKVDGLTDELMSKPENAADVAALLKRLNDISRRTGLDVDLGDANAETVALGIIDEVNRGGLEKTQRMLETRSKLLELLMKSSLGNGVTYDEASFREALEKTSNGRRFVDSHGNIYGFKDADGVLHFNPAALNLNTPIHEYGHLALESLKTINNPLWKKGMELVKESDYFKEIERLANTEGHEYNYLKGDIEGICDEALATLIGDRGQRLVEGKGVDAGLKAWLKEFWAAFKQALGIADLTEEQIEQMTLKDFADAMNAELLRGKEFGTRKARPLEKRSIRRYDEEDGSGSNGVLRWKNDRGRLFYIPVDMERTQPGGKVVLSTDDANITDWIEHRLNGVELRMSKSGRIYVKGRNGFEGELAEIFGRYPKAGSNDGIFEELTAELNGGLRGAEAASQDGEAAKFWTTPDQLVEALAKDRANYNEWLEMVTRQGGRETGLTLEALREERHYAEEAEREEAEALERFENGGMGVLDYVRSRAAEEGENAFDLDWETMREIAREQEEGKFAVVGVGGARNLGIEKVGDAEQMEKAGANREEIWRKTGWWRGRDGKWRVEMPPIAIDGQKLKQLDVNRDNYNFRKRKAQPEYHARLEDLIADKQLVAKLNAAYGTLPHISVVDDVGWALGRFRPETNSIDIHRHLTAAEMRSVVEHELQHFIQHKEGFSEGGDNTGGEYRNLAGEVEARNAARREAMSPEERAATPPWATEDVPEDRQIVKFAVGKALNRTPEESSAIRQEAETKNSEANQTLDKLTAINQQFEAAKKAGGEKAAAAKKEYYRSINEQFGPNFMFDLGRPYGRLASYVPDRPLKLEMKVLLRKMKEEYRNHHPFTFDEAKDLVLNVNDPAFFMRRDGSATGVRAFYETGSGRVFCASVKPNGEINEIETLYPKDIGRLATMLASLKKKNALLDLDIDKAVAMLERQYNTAIIPELRDSLKSAISVLKNFASVKGGIVSAGNPDVRFAVGRGGVSGLDGSEPIIDRARFVSRRARVAADAGVGEQTPGAIAASRELATQGTTPISQLGQFRKMSLPLSELEHLRRTLFGDALPAHIAARLPGGRAAARTKGGRLFIAADVFGLVDGTDMAKEKETLKQHGFYRNEDEQWCAVHSAAEIRGEQRRSEDQLATQLLNLGRRRITPGGAGESGGLSAARRVFADQLAKMVMDMPQQMGGVLGSVQKLGKGVKADVRARFSDGVVGAKNEAGDFLDWAYGGGLRGTEPANQDTRRAEAMSLDELTSSMFGAWLVMPAEVERRAPNWDATFTAAIAADARLRNAYSDLMRRGFSVQAHTAVEAKIEEMLSRTTEEALRKLDADASEKIGAGSKLANAKETLLVAFHDKFAPVYVRIDEKVKAYVKAKEKVLRRTASAADRAAIRAEIDLFEGGIANGLHKLELSRTACERGAWNEGRRYFMEMARLENDATERWGLEQRDISMYLHLQRVIETQGRAASFGQSPQQARLSLGDMARRLGAAKWARMEEYSRRFHAIIEREIYDDPRMARAFGQGIVDYFRTQSHYVTTRRTFSVEERDAIELARARIRSTRRGAGGSGVVDDVVDEMYRYAGASGASDVLGVSAGQWTAALKGSFAATQEARSATWVKQSAMMQFLRRNQMMLDLRDVLTAANVEGVRVMDAAEGAKFPDNKRYGHLTFMENGQKKVMVVPKQIAEAFKADPDSASWITAVNRLVRKGLIDYNLAYWPMNVRRNQGSIEMNMAGMRETYLKTALRAVVPAASPVMDLALQALVRNVPAAGCLFNEHTVFAHIPKAERYARILEDLGGWQKELWAAEDAHDAAKVTRMYDDYAGVMEMLKGNFLLPTATAYAGGEGKGSFAFEAMNRKGVKTLAQIEEESQGDTRWSRAVRAVNIFRKNQAQQEHEDILAKTVAYLHDRMAYGSRRTVEESGLEVKRNVSIAEGERKGRLARPVQQAMAQFFNMVEKGVVRHWRNYGERPGEMLVKDGKVWIGRMAGTMLACGAVKALMMAMSDGDEEKAKAKFGVVYDYADAYHKAWRNCSNYVKENYSFTPVWNGPDGYTSIVIGGALTDEEKLIAPMADFVAGWAAHKAGVGPKPEIGKAVANSTFKAVVPDFAMAAPLMNVLRSTVEATFLDNPTDYFRNAPMYDQSLWQSRNESWEMRGKFAFAMGAKLWGDLGGRGILAPSVNGVDNGRGAAPESVEAVLRKIPVVSPVIARMVKIQVGSPAKRGEAITAEAKRRRSVIDVCAKDLLRRVDGNGVDFWERDSEAYEAQLKTWKKRYGLNELDMARLRAKYLNATIQRKNRKGFDQKELQKLMKTGREMGMTDEDIWLQLGDM